MMMENSREAEDERRGVKRKIALSSCDVCETEEAKYRCPCCTTHTCSLACVKQHKTESGCCGVRDKTAFVPLAEFNEINLLSDYRFLEDTARLRQQSNRDAVLNMWLIRKAKAAKVTLKFLPKIFSKHRENRTVFKSAEGRFHWYLKIHFPQSNAVYSERFPDDKQLEKILNDYIHPSESDPVQRQKLKMYVHNPLENITVFLKAEQKQHDSPRYLELDLRKSLRENLMHKTIVEFPEVFVVLKPHSQEFLARVSERSSAVPCVTSASVSSAPCSPTEPRSEAPVRVLKRPRVAEDEELEDGELRSDEEEGSTDGNLPCTENKVPDDERELHDSAPGDGNRSQEVSGNINSVEYYTSRSGEMMLVSEDAGDQDTEALIDEGFSLHGCQQNLPGLPVEDGNGGAKHDNKGKIDSEHDCSQTSIDNSPILSCLRSDASEIEGQENTHGAENPNIDSSESVQMLL